MPVYKDEERKTWYFKVRYKDVYGRNKQAMRRGFKQRREAIQAEADFLSNLKSTLSDNATIEEIFEHNLKHKKLKQKTVRRRRNEYKLHIQPRFGHLKANEIITPQIIDFKTYLENNFNSLNSARAIFSSFKAVINHAIKFFGLRVDPTIAVDPIQRVRPHFDFIKRDDFEKRINLIDHLYYRQLTRLLFYTGLRIGEAFALTWRDIDFEKNQLHVNKAVDIINRAVTSPKTAGSVAYVPFPIFIGEMLQAIKNESENKIYGFNDEMYVFGGLAPYHYSHYRMKFKKAFQGYRIHDLRHSYATYLINKGIDIYLVKELMRHDDIKQTANTYGHLYMERKQEAMSVFD